MADEVDYSQLSQEELEAEIRREEEALATYRTDLALAERRKADLEAALSEERLKGLRARVKARQERIERYERSLAELDSQISRMVSRVRTRGWQLDEINKSLRQETARLSRVAGVERFITSEVIARLNRAIKAQRGWLTRDIDYAAVLRDTQTRHRHVLASLHQWQTREAGLLERIEEILQRLKETIDEIRTLQQKIDTETQRLETKKKYLKPIWKSFVYVLYYAYVNPGAERHLEAHLEGKCLKDEKVQEKVKKLANLLLRTWVAQPLTTTEGKLRPGYAVPLLISEMAKPPYQGARREGAARWQWGVQWESAINYSVDDGRIVPVEPKQETKDSVTLRAELFDFNYAQLRLYNEYVVPALWWELSISELLRLFRLTEGET